MRTGSQEREDERRSGDEYVWDIELCNIYTHTHIQRNTQIQNTYSELEFIVLCEELLIGKDRIQNK